MIKIIIQQTTNYNQFKLIKGNRLVNKSHLNGLIRSIASRNLLELAPILVNEKMEVIDGQHRLEAAKRSAAPIYYRVVEGLSDTETFQNMITLNTVNRPWNLTDYLDSYTNLGVGDYVAAKALYDEYGVRLFIILLYLTRSDNRARVTQLRREFREGRFKIDDMDYAIKMLGALEELKPFLAQSVWNQTEFNFALIKLDALEKIPKLIGKLRSSGKKIFRKDYSKEYMRDFEDILNLRSDFYPKKD